MIEVRHLRKEYDQTVALENLRLEIPTGEVYGLIGPSAVNAAPVVGAGVDQHLAAPGQTTLSGTATDDGNPTPPGRLTTIWTLASGPAAVAIGTPNALTTTVDFTVAGAYTLRLSAFDGEATTSDDVLITVDPPAGSGTGLLGQYFNDAGSGVYFTSLALTRTDSSVDFDWAAAAPDPVVQADNFSVRWSGQLMAPVTATYTFRTTSDDGVRFYVNGQPQARRVSGLRLKSLGDPHSWALPRTCDADFQNHSPRGFHNHSPTPGIVFLFF